MEIFLDQSQASLDGMAEAPAWSPFQADSEHESWTTERITLVAAGWNDGGRRIPVGGCSTRNGP